jgi:hypothetical protein
MNETVAVEIDKNVEHGLKHIAGFGSREWPLGEDLGKVLFGMFHDDVETIPVAEAATANVVEAQQIGMGKLHDAEPERELVISSGPGGNEFDRGLSRLRIIELCQENGGVVRTPKVMPQPELIVNNLTFTLIPEMRHTPPPTANSTGPAGRNSL